MTPWETVSSRAVPVDPSRAERLLNVMHQVFSHDLPNQLVVVQSLINLLRDEAGRLSGDGQEVLERVSVAAHRAGDMVHFLKDMARLGKMTETLEEIKLSALAREIQAELNHLLPQRDLDLQTDWHVSFLYAGRRTLHQAIVQLLRCGIESFPNRGITLTLGSKQSGNEVQIEIGVRPREGPLLPGDSLPRHDRTKPEQRLEFLLAKELLALWGGNLTARPQPGESFQFAIGVPTGT